MHLLALCVVALGGAGWSSLLAAGAMDAGTSAMWEWDGIAQSSHPSLEGTLKWLSPPTDMGAFDVTAEWSNEAELVPLPSDAELRALVDRLADSGGAGEGALRAAWAKVAAALQSIRALIGPTSVRAVETCLEVLEAGLDAFLDQVAEQATIDRGTAVRLFARANELEKHADRLESVASRIRLYGKGAAAAALAEELEKAVRALADADCDAYVERLRRIAAAAEAARGGELRRDAADSMRADCDALVLRLAARTIQREVSMAWSAEVFGVDLQLELADEATQRASPSGGLRSVSASGTVSYEAEAAEFAGSFDVQAVRADDRLREGPAGATRGATASAVWHPGEADVEAAISWEQEQFPFMIDAEIEESAVGDVKHVVDEIALQVRDAGLSASVEKRLRGDLDDVRSALATGMRGDAADALEDFIDRVESERWKGGIPAGAAARWTERAAGIQPRRTVRRLEVPFQVEAPIGEDTASVELEWSATDYPANSALSVTKSTGTVTWSGERSGWQIDASVGRTESFYPAALAKNAATSELVLDLTREADDLALGAATARYTRPASPESDHEDATLHGSISGTWSIAAWTLAGSDEVRRYPNRPSSSPTRTTEGTLDVELTLSEWELGLTWTGKSVRATGEDPGDDTTTLSVDWSHEADGVEVGLSIDWSRHTDWGNPGGDRETLLLAAELAIAF